jgi:hypothetical protein
MKLSISPRLAELPFSTFKKWMGEHYPGEDAAKWYKSLGGKMPKKDAVPQPSHDNDRATGPTA